MERIHLASPECIMPRVEANRLIFFLGSMGRQNLHDSKRVSPVDLRKPFTFYDLKCKMKFIMGRKFTDEDLKLFLNQGLSQV